MSLRRPRKCSSSCPLLFLMIAINPPPRCRAMTFPLEMPNRFFQRNLLSLLQRQAPCLAFEAPARAIAGKAFSSQGGGAVTSQGSGFVTAWLCSSCKRASRAPMSLDSKTFTVLVYILKGFSFCWKFASWQLWNLNVSVSFQFKYSSTDRSFPHCLMSVFCKTWARHWWQLYPPAGPAQAEDRRSFPAHSRAVANAHDVLILPGLMTVGSLL